MTFDRATLVDHVTELIEHGGYLERLTQALTEGANGARNRDVSGGASPWNDQAAELMFEIHAGAREHETNLRWLAGWPSRPRGGSDGMTRAALRNLPDLIEHTRGHRSSPWPEVAASAIAGWPRRCRALFDELRDDELEPTRAPGGLLCPYCESRLIIEPDFAMKPNPRIWCPSRECRVDGVNLSWPAGEWLGALQEIEDTPKPKWPPYVNQGSGRA